MCVFSQRNIEIILNILFILLLGSCPRGAGVKSFSVGISDGAPSTARSSLIFFFSKKSQQIETLVIAFLQHILN